MHWALPAHLCRLGICVSVCVCICVLCLECVVVCVYWCAVFGVCWGEAATLDRGIAMKDRVGDRERGKIRKERKRKQIKSLQCVTGTTQSPDWTVMDLLTFINT